MNLRFTGWRAMRARQPGSGGVLGNGYASNCSGQLTCTLHPRVFGDHRWDRGPRPAVLLRHKRTQCLRRTIRPQSVDRYLRRLVRRAGEPRRRTAFFCPKARAPAEQHLVVERRGFDRRATNKKGPSKGLGDPFTRIYAAVLGSTGRPSLFHASQPPTSARAFGQPAVLSSRATRALVASSFQAQ